MKRQQPDIVVAPGSVVRTLTPAEAREFGAQWLLAFPADHRGIHVEQHMWHIFSFHRYPSVSKSTALSEYSKHQAAEYVLISNDQDEGVITDLRPTECSLRDYLVFPANFAWTMAFTNEDGWIGPFFARHRDFSARDAANLASVKKRNEAAAARRNGWA